jgi:hypothetical protein
MRFTKTVSARREIIEFALAAADRPDWVPDVPLAAAFHPATPSQFACPPGRLAS